MERVNKLASSIFNKTKWGFDVVWSITDNYMARTVEILPQHRTPFGVYREKYKTILVIEGELFYHFQDGSEYKITNIQEGWYQFIPIGTPHAFEAREKPVKFIEISNPILEDPIFLIDKDGKDLKSESYAQLKSLFNTDAYNEAYDASIKRSITSTKKRRQVW